MLNNAHISASDQHSSTQCKLKHLVLTQAISIIYLGSCIKSTNTQLSSRKSDVMKSSPCMIVKSSLFRSASDGWALHPSLFLLCGCPLGWLHHCQVPSSILPAPHPDTCIDGEQETLESQGCPMPVLVSVSLSALPALFCLSGPYLSEVLAPVLHFPDLFDRCKMKRTSKRIGTTLHSIPEVCCLWNFIKLQNL